MSSASLVRTATTTLTIAVVLQLALAAAPLPSRTATAHASDSVSLQRLEGPDRIATAVAVARAGFGQGASTAIVARADDFPDAMAAAALAGVHGGPVLLSHSNSVPDALGAALGALDVRNVVLVGGPGALSESVERHLARNRDVARISGTDRFDTAARIAREVARRGEIGKLDGKRTALLASGDAFPDALAAGAIAYNGGHPILLTRRSSLPQATADAISSLSIEHVVTLGGRAAVSSAVTEQVRSLGVSVSRVGGASRTETAANIADLGTRRVGLEASAPFLVRGDAFADALVAGPAAGSLGSPILLTASPSQASGPTQQWFADNCRAVQAIFAVGGSGAISSAAAGAARSSAAECRVTGNHGIAGTAVGAATTGPTAYTDPALGRRLTYDDLQPSGTITTSRDGQVIEKRDVTGQIRIAHDNVTVRAVRIRNSSTDRSAYSISYAQGANAKGATIEYVEIDGSGATESVGVVLNNFTIRHSHIRGHRSGLHFGTNSTVESSYIHSQIVTSGSHNTAMATHGATGAVIRGNNLVGSTSSALSLYPDFGPVRDILIEQNLFNGGAYCTYGGSGPKPYAGQTERIRYVDNAFGRAVHDNCGRFGPVTVFRSNLPGNVWSGNVWEHSGQPISGG